MQKISRVFRSIFPPVVGAAIGSFAVIAYIHLGVAHAAANLVDPAVTPGSGFDWMGTVALIAAIGVGLGAMLGGLAAILHAVAARTGNASVEKVAVEVDRAHERLDEFEKLISQFTGVKTAAPKENP